VLKVAESVKLTIPFLVFFRHSLLYFYIKVLKHICKADVMVFGIGCCATWPQTRYCKVSSWYSAI